MFIVFNRRILNSRCCIGLYLYFLVICNKYKIQISITNIGFESRKHLNTNKDHSVLMYRFHEELRRIKDLLQKSSHGMSITEIAMAVSKNKHSVGRYLDVLQALGQVEMRTYGMAKVYTHSQRVPFSEILSCSRELFILIDNDERIIQINDLFLELLQNTREQVIGKNIRFVQSTRPGVADLLQEIANTLNSKKIPDSLTLEDEKRYFQPRYIATTLEDGNNATIITLNEITDKVKAYVALKESETLFRGLAENTKDGVIISEGDSYLYCNPRSEEILGYSREEILSADPFQFIVPEEREKIQELSARHQEKGDTPEEFRVWIMRKDGEKRYLLCRLSKVAYENNYRFYIVLTDITDWKERDDEIKDQVALIRHLMDAFPRPVYYMNAEGQLMGCNKAFESATGIERQESIGRPIRDICPEDLSFALMKGAGEYVSTGGSFSHPAKILYNDGSIHDLLIEKAVISGNSPNKGWLIGILVEKIEKNKISVNC